MSISFLQTADISTGHLSLLTREWLSSDDRKPFSPARRDEGFLISTIYSDPLSGVGASKMPPDLHLVLSAARVSGADYVLFDRDAPRVPDLPYYEDGNHILDRGSRATHFGEPVTALHTAWKPEHGIKERNMLEAYAAGSIPDKLLSMRGTQEIPDGDYIAQDGAWIEAGEVLVRIAAVEDGVNIEAYVKTEGDLEDASLRALTIGNDEIATLQRELADSSDLEP